MIKEKIFVCCAIGLFGLIGLGLLRAAYLELRRVARARRRLIRITGTVLTVAKVTEHRPGSSGGSHYKSNVVLKLFPVIAYTTPEGQRVEFRSETGQIHHVRRDFSGKSAEPPREWRDGQSIEILHDPAGEIRPCLAETFALWGMGIGMAAASLMFLAATSFMVVMAIRKVFV